mgnify:CR=1 FL=1
MPRHTLHAHHRHYGWDRDQPPALTVAPGDELELEVRDASDGQVTQDAEAEILTRLDPDRVNPVGGPVVVDGAAPGDAVVVEVLDLEGVGWGWTGLIPGFGLLADEFPEPHLVISRYDGQVVEPLPGVRIPQRSFPGTVGLAPAAPGPHGVIPPRRVGGNMDYRRLTAGARVTLPVEVEGALLSLGDTHAAQGHGEVCGTAVETAMRARIRVGLEKAVDPAGSRFPRFEVPPDPRRGSTGLVVTSGIGPDLWTAAKDAVREMIDALMRTHGLSAEDAYCLASIAGDLVLGEVVDAPHWMVAMELPTDIFG